MRLEIGNKAGVRGARRQYVNWKQAISMAKNNKLKFHPQKVIGEGI